MLKNQDIICISSIDWDFLWQGHQEIMTRFARNGNRVLFIENTGVRVPRISDISRIKNRIANWKKGLHGIRKIEDGLYVYSPLVLPFPYLKIARFINKRLMFSVLFKWLKTVGFSEPIVWAFLPTGLSLDLIGKIEPKILVYYCIDSFQASSKDARKIKKTEEQLLKKADVVFVTSEALFKYCSRYNTGVNYFPFGVSIENFKKALTGKGAAPADIKPIKRPIAGYIGGIHKWVDLELVRHVADENKDISFVFCGPIQVDVAQMKNVSNVTLLGQKRTEDLPMYVKEFDVALIPYKITEYTNNVYPTKLNEYLSVGKRVVSTDLVEVRKFNAENGAIVRIGRSPEEFSEKVRQAVNVPPDEKEKAAAISAADKNSWSNKLEKMSALIEGIVEEKARRRELDWKMNLSRLFRKARKRIVPLAAVMAITYFVIFYTPLIWLVAKPLEVNSFPLKSDVIAVFAGGVGESGKPGEGYQERVDTAINLYKNEFSGKILYLSGYKYIMKEALVMKALSVEMGAKESDIVLDDTPVNTYQMVLDLSRFAGTNNWKDIIVVSSPYNMLRIKLLCDRHLKSVRIFYVPVEKSEYYAKRRRVELKQINGILREYLAIAYYKLKGYI